MSEEQEEGLPTQGLPTPADRATRSRGPGRTAGPAARRCGTPRSRRRTARRARSADTPNRYSTHSGRRGDTVAARDSRECRRSGSTIDSRNCSPIAPAAGNGNRSASSNSSSPSPAECDDTYDESEERTKTRARMAVEVTDAIAALGTPFGRGFDEIRRGLLRRVRRRVLDFFAGPAHNKEVRHTLFVHTRRTYSMVCAGIKQARQLCRWQ